jgi:iron complex transport system ATP-binding protein
VLTIDQSRCNISHKTLIAVEHLNLTQHQLFGLLGPNGAGKTSLLKMISGDLPYSGSIKLHDRELSTWPTLQRAQHVGVLPQSNSLSFPFSAEEVVALGLTPLRLCRRESVWQIKQHMRSTQCEHLAQRIYTSLSGGERQRVQLARVLLQVSQAEEAPLLLLDEPTSAQDLGQQHHLLALTKDLTQKQGYGVMAILHDLNQVLRYCDFCAIVDQGRIGEQGPPQTTLNSDSVAHYWQYRPTLLHTDHHLVMV